MCGGVEFCYLDWEILESKEFLLLVYLCYVNYLFYKKDEGLVILFLISIFLLIINKILILKGLYK